MATIALAADAASSVLGKYWKTLNATALSNVASNLCGTALKLRISETYIAVRSSLNRSLARFTRFDVSAPPKVTLENPDESAAKKTPAPIPLSHKQSPS
eukprot:CAMPEP_0179431628 /NCGR_PEP_ID=MMETSP0799-20121207/16469_1 /TAXON_ID=46947 /ORGANISM="Geminigera cryophila, Strain CCMP2564" /LENGTH=98 /DNA_ID=CAMNT_0021208651 /DNA_START=564 /DNA_END=860 /DNA_ORIENTATION=+